MANRTHGIFARFLRSDRGSIAAWGAAALVVSTGAAGFAVDHTRASNARAEMQRAVDAGALAAVRFLPDTVRAEAFAREMATENLQAVLGEIMPEITVGFSAEGGATDDTGAPENDTIEVAMSLSTTSDTGLPTYFGGITGVDYFDIDVAATAALSGELKEPICLLAIHPTLKHILYFLDDSSVNAPDCHAFSNSNHPDDAVDPRTMRPVITKSIGTMGGGHNNLYVLDPPYYDLNARLPDPFEAMPMPVPETLCKETDLELALGETRAVQPGTYCGGIVIGESATLTLAPGLYTIRDGDLEIEDGGRIEGHGVTLFLDEDVKIDTTNADIILSAPATGPLTGMALIADRRLDDDGDVDDGGFRHEIGVNDLSIEGVVYMPQGDWHITLMKDAAPANLAKWTAIITRGIITKGDGTWHIGFKPEDSAVPLPDGMDIVPTGVRVPRLKS